MVSSDDKGKNIEDEIQKASDKLSTSPLQPYYESLPSEALIAHGKLLVLTSEKITLSINKLHESSKRLEELMEKLSQTTEELSKSSNQLERYTYVLIVLTVVLIVLTILSFIFPSDPMLVKAVFVIIAVAIVIKGFPQLKKKE